MIEIVDTGSRDLPVIRCDTCARPITGDGIVTWDSALGVPHYYHKGACDPRTEQLSIELGEFLSDLVENAKPGHFPERGGSS